jgi:hypothetical protein
MRYLYNLAEIDDYVGLRYEGMCPSFNFSLFFYRVLSDIFL